MTSNIMTKTLIISQASKLRFGVAVLALGLSASLVSAQVESERGPAPQLKVQSADRSSSRKIDISIGKSLVITLPSDAKEVFVADPKVANAVVRSSRQIYIIGLTDGYTSVLAIDAEGRQIAALDVSVGRDLKSLETTLRSALPKAKIDVQSAGTSVLLTGTVNNASEATQAVDIANAFVGTTASLLGSSRGSVINSLSIRGRDQVMVKVVVAEVSRRAIKQLGINSSGQWKVGNFNLTPSIENPLPLSPQALSATAITAGLGNASNFTLRALERIGVARTLAEPTVTAMSGESAKFTAGGEIPVPKGLTCQVDTFGRQSCQVSLEYKPIGVSLNFLPVVMGEGRISMRVATEVTELDFENQFRLGEGAGIAATNAPAFRVRKSDTTVELPSGGSMVTAGLIQRMTKTSLNGLPGLMNIPVLGALFRSRDYQREETELMIVVTPYIAQAVASNQVQRPTDGFVDSHDAQALLLGRLNQIYGGQGTPAPSQYKGRVGFIAD
jgi:pilus assembly protein CpaC